MKAVVLGVIAGILSGTFGIGSAPFIQIGLMILLRLSIRQSVGTTMLVIIPLAVGGGLGYVTEGFVDYMLLVKVLIGTMCGAYVGAKFTNLVPKVILKSAIFLTPAIAGLMLLF
ncbi:putative integral inner membrane protein [Bacillus velezensis]|nr:putative integral inner membrane protein [Bacillus velezensis]